MSRADRVDTILDRVRAGRSVRAADLAREFAVSAATVRRDLQLLADHHLLARTHGGALAFGLSDERPLSYRAERNRAQKQLIATATAALLPQGPVVIGMTGGTTTREVARAIAQRVDITVVTNAIDIAMELYHHPRLRVVVTGGTTRPLSGEMVGPLVTRTLAPMRLAVAIIGVDGVDVEAGLSTHDRDEAAANAAMVAAAKTVVVAADGSKLGRVFGAHIAATSAVHDIVTDDSADPQVVHCLQAIGVRVHVVARNAHAGMHT